MPTKPSSPARGPDDRIVTHVTQGLSGARLVAYTAAAVVVGAGVTLFLPRAAESRLRADADRLRARVDALEASVFNAPPNTDECAFSGPETIPATIRITADDEYALTVNGALIDGTSRLWMHPQTYNVRLLRNPALQNVIAVRATNRENAAGLDRGLIADITVVTEAGEQHIVTDGEWRATDTPAGDWTSPGYDDTAWRAPTLEGAHGTAPWGPVLGASHAQWLWTSMSDGPAASKPSTESAAFRRRFFISKAGLITAAAVRCATSSPLTPPARKEVPPVQDGGLVAWWRLDGNGTDSAGEHPLRISDGVHFAAGKAGQSAEARGNTPGMSAEAIHELDMNKDFTLSMWVHRNASIFDNDALFDNGAIYLAKRDAWGSRVGAFLNSDVDKPFAELVDNSPSDPIGTGEWANVLLYRRGDVIGIRVDGRGDSTVNVAGRRFMTGDAVRVGVQRHGYPLQGRIDEVALWNRALTEDGMRALAAGERAGSVR